MELWARWVVAVVALVAALAIGVPAERRLQALLVRWSRRSAARATAVLLGYHLALVVVLVLAIGVVALVRDASEVAAVVTIGVLFALLAPFTLPLMPGVAGSSSSDAHRSGDLSRARATPAVSRVLGLGGAVLWFVVMAPAMLVAVVGVFVGPRS